MPPIDTGGTRFLGGRGQSQTDQRNRFDDVEGHLWVVVVVALVLDVGLTYWGLQLGLVEANPVLRRGIEWLGPAALGVAKCSALAVGVLCRVARPRCGAVVPLALALPWLAAAAVNSAHIATALVT